MALDWKKIKKSITLPALIVIVVTVLVTDVTHDVRSWIWGFAKNLIFPTKLELAFTKFIIYRTESDQFPTCDMDIVVRSHSNENLTAELRELRFFGRDMVYRFGAGQQVIKTQGVDVFSKHITFQDKVLDDALKIPQDSNTAILELKYQYVGAKSTATLKLTNRDVMKCTYWQNPMFNSDTEAAGFGAIPFGIIGRIYWHTDKAHRKKGSTDLNIKGFTDQYGLYDFDMTEFGRRIMSKDFSWSYYLPAFKRKYGGIYFGFLASDSGKFERTKFPHQLFGNLKDYDEYNLTGSSFDQDFSRVKEFIYYDFDPARRQELFEICYENSKYYILLVYEKPEGIRPLAQNLTAKGYRVGSASANFFGGLAEVMTLITPKEKLPSLAERFKTHVDSLNSVMSNDGVFVFFPVELDAKTINRITSDIRQLTGKERLVAFAFDCRPFKSRLPNAPFSTPVLTFLNFSETTMDAKLDSVGVKW